MTARATNRIAAPPDAAPPDATARAFVAAALALLVAIACGLAVAVSPPAAALADDGEAELKADDASGETTAPAAAPPANEPAAEPEGGTTGPAAMGPGAIAFEGIRIDPAARVIEVEAWFAVAHADVRLEYAAVHPKRGKLHESLLAIECAPEKLQLGLILLGLEPRPELRWQGQARALTAPRVSIEVAFQRDGEAGGEAVRLPLESLIVDLYTGRPLEPIGFAFTGSRFVERPGAEPEFAAEGTGNAIALYHDPDACLDNPRLSGGDIPLLVPTFGLVELVDWLSADDRLVANDAQVPPRGTACVLTIRPLDAATPAPGASEDEGAR